MEHMQVALSKRDVRKVLLALDLAAQYEDSAQDALSQPYAATRKPLKDYRSAWKQCGRNVETFGKIRKRIRAQIAEVGD